MALRDSLARFARQDPLAALRSRPARPAPAVVPSGPPSNPGPQAPDRKAILERLVQDNLLGHQDFLDLISYRSLHQVRLTDLLLSRGLVSAEALYRVLGQMWHKQLADPVQTPADLRLVDRIGAERCLRDGLLPWRNAGGTTVLLVAYPEEFARHRDDMTAEFGLVSIALAPFAQIEAALRLLRGPRLAREAELRVPSEHSCRDWSGREGPRLKLALLIFGMAAVAFPVTIFNLAFVVAVISLVPVTGLKLAALIASALPVAPRPASTLAIARGPIVSIIVALYKESDIAGRLVRRLSRLDYPHDLLDVLLAVEEDDHITRNTLGQTELPAWMRIVIVPRGQLKTKPRALNFALTLCRGSIVGVYDAEDAPEPDQISKVVRRFHERGPEVACLQGVLDFYNPTDNWLARCFTLEYGGWFRVILPGLARMGMPVPLGGTTLFLRRPALVEVGGWDAHNVTEDADLGLRLARHGFRTELIETTTYEEANCRTLPWIKQRSRWIKGYMMTYAVHMRRPNQTRRDLGWRGFLGFQILFLGSLSQALLLPVLWSAWAIAFGLPHPAADAFSPFVLSALLVLALGCEICGFLVHALGRLRSGQPIGLGWILSLSFYFPLAALASYKALWEAVRHPFYWDKTSHGHLSGSASHPK